MRAIAMGAALFALAIAATTAQGATASAAKRCTPTVTQTSRTYNCWSAYPEAFYVTGYTGGTFQIDWRLSCSGKSLSGRARVHHLIHVVVNQFTQPAAYRLMITHDLCRVYLAARHLSGSSSIKLDLFINQNHPQPVLG